MAGKPSLLFIFTDQQRADTMRCYGNDLINTPNLNRLANESFAFENAYVTQPVCTPARSSIMTGLYPHTSGYTSNNVPLRPETRTLAEMVSEEYLCAYYGKWHLGDEIVPQHGFTQRLSIDDGYRPWYSMSEYLSRFSDYYHFLVENGLEPDQEVEGARVFSRHMAVSLPEHLTKAGFLGREVARFIRENRERPFVLYVNFFEPHNPYTGPLDHMHPRGALATGPHFLEKPPRNASTLHRMMADYYMQSTVEGHDLTTESGWREIRARYWGNVALVDRAVGDILDAVEESGLAESTILAYSSEHGDMMGDHGILEKTVMYEEAIKVPLLVRAPWLSSKGKMVKGRVSQIDLVPTFLDMMGEAIPRELEGESLLPVLRGDATLEKNDVFVQWNEGDGRHAGEWETDIPREEIERVAEMPWRSVVSAEGWKLNLSPGDQCELYDLNSDPYEQTNLFDERGQRDRKRDLADRIRRWQERTGDSVSLALL